MSLSRVQQFNMSACALASFRYEFYYKQAVETQDAFLGMGDKDPSSTQCEDIVLRVELPGTYMYSKEY